MVAQAAYLDTFAINIAYGDNTVSTSLSHTFTAANTKGFKLFFSFDYTGGTGPWPQADILNPLNSYGPNGAYYHTASGQPFVSFRKMRPWHAAGRGGFAHRPDTRWTGFRSFRGGCKLPK